MIKSFKFSFILLLILTCSAQAQTTKTLNQSLINTNLATNNANLITAANVRLPLQSIVNSYLDLNGATSFTCPASQVVTGFTNLSTPTCNLLSSYLTTTGTGAFVLANSPILVTPNLGTPSVLTLTNASGLPLSTGITGFGTGVSTALSTAIGSAGSIITNGGALGTPSSGVGTNLTALNANNITSGILASTQGGAGTVNGALKGNGLGVTSQAACSDLSNASSYCSAARGQLLGTTTNDNACAGCIGEYVTATASGVAITSGAAFNTTAISLTAGDWDVWGYTNISNSGTTTYTFFSTGISLTNSVLGGQVMSMNLNIAGATYSFVAPQQRISIAITTTVFLVGSATFTGGTPTAAGSIYARRVR